MSHQEAQNAQKLNLFVSFYLIMNARMNTAQPARNQSSFNHGLHSAAKLQPKERGSVTRRSFAGHPAF
jgi:hypothetical protein